jgi:folate-dependent tRNA-U54 methylase TrmFO/GidA
MARRTGSSVSVESSYAFTGSDTVVFTDALLPSCDMHSIDCDGAVTVKMRIGEGQVLKVVGVIADDFLNIHLGGVTSISITETGATTASVRIHSSRV